MTPRQRQCLDFIAAYTLANRYSPTYAEIGDYLGVSINTVSGLLSKLELSGHIWREPGCIRNVRVRVMELTSPKLSTQQRAKTSRYWGVSRNRNIWVARVRVNSRTVEYIGSHTTELGAAKAYDAYVRSHQLDKPLNFGERKTA